MMLLLVVAYSHRLSADFAETECDLCFARSCKLISFSEHIFHEEREDAI